LDVDVVIESSGHFTDSAGMDKHLQAGAKRVLLSAPADGSGVATVVHGVNDKTLTDATRLVANASCTTNCIAPVAAVILKEFGIEKAMMTTVHSYTADQVLQDGPHKDLRRARAAGINIVPTTTGATKAASKALPELENNFAGLAIRVPTPVGSLSDFTFLTKKSTTVEAVNKALQEASQTDQFKGIIEVTTAPLVSSDIVGNKASAIVDMSLTQVVGGNLVKVVAWYDNEWGYTNRLIDVVESLMCLNAPKKSPTEVLASHTAPVTITHQEKVTAPIMASGLPNAVGVPPVNHNVAIPNINYVEIHPPVPADATPTLVTSVPSVPTPAPAVTATSATPAKITPLSPISPPQSEHPVA